MTTTPLGDNSPKVDSYEFIQTFSLVDMWTPNLREAAKRVLEIARASITAAVSRPATTKALAKAALVYSYASLRQLPDYATLSYEHITRVQEVITAIKDYHGDKSLERPLNFLVLASPGSGKSQLVKSIAKKLGEMIGLVAFNMATMHSKDNFGHVLDAARNFVVGSKLPLVFLDEFDSHESHYPFLLPLLWDGELDVSNRNLRVGKSIFFLAGSRPSLPKRMVGARQMFESKEIPPGDDDKLVDLFSRVNGLVIDVPSLEDPLLSADKVVLAMHLLRHRFKSCNSVPRSLLAFIARARFRYQARSIATFIGMIQCPPNVPGITSDNLRTLPLGASDTRGLKDSALAFHLIHEDGASGLLKLWAETNAIEGTQEIRDKELEEGLMTPGWAELAASVLTQAGSAILAPTPTEAQAAPVAPPAGGVGDKGDGGAGSPPAVAS